MPANISERNGEAAVMVVGKPAWHRLGTVLDKPATAEEAIKAAHLDWSVIKQPLFAEHHRVPDYYAVVRGDDWSKKKATVLGIVRGAYRPVQNREAFTFFDSIVGKGAAIYHTAGALGLGERVWILAKLPDEIRVIAPRADSGAKPTRTYGARASKTPRPRNSELPRSGTACWR